VNHESRKSSKMVVNSRLSSTTIKEQINSIFLDDQHVRRKSSMPENENMKYPTLGVEDHNSDDIN